MNEWNDEKQESIGRQSVEIIENWFLITSTHTSLWLSSKPYLERVFSSFAVLEAIP